MDTRPGLHGLIAEVVPQKGPYTGLPVAKTEKPYNDLGRVVTRTEKDNPRKGQKQLPLHQ